MKEITATELKQRLDNKENFQLIDVREPYEHEQVSIGGELIPVGSILNEVEKISKDKDVVIYCRSGSRSGAVIHELEKRHGFSNLINLKGGILAYARDLDNSLTPY